MSTDPAAPGSPGSPDVPHRSLDSLKKEAKAWLRALRAGRPDAVARLERAFPGARPALPMLRDVQLALARVLGFPGWAALKAAVLEATARRQAEAQDAFTRAALAGFEEKADALLQAYRLGTPEAMERHYRLTWHRRAWEGMKRYVRLDLGRLDGTPGFEDDITPDDARSLVAREHGYESWDALVRDLAGRRPGGGPFTARPVEVLRPGVPRGRHPERHSRDWAIALDRLEEPSVLGLDAHGQLTDELAEDLVGLDHLTVLSAEGCKGLTDEGIRHLAELPGLKHLDLSGTGLTDTGLEALGRLTALETLNLSGARVTDAGMRHLAGLERLTRVELMWTRTGDGALLAFAGKPRLADFRSGNYVTDEGLRALHDYPQFARWQGGPERIELTSFDAGPTNLFLRGAITDRGMQAFAGLDGLFALNLDDANLPVTALGLAELRALPHLAWLAHPAPADAMAVIATLPALRFLSCQDTTTGDDGWIALARSPTLEGIWGRHAPALTDRGFRALAAMPTMKMLSINLANVSDDGLALLPTMPALVELMPMGVPDEGYRHIGRCPQLESLVLMYCRETGDRATEHLTGLPRLRKYFASYNHITDRTPELLATIPTLEEVILSAIAGVTDAGVAHLARLPRLRKVSVSGHKVTSAAAKAFPPHVDVHIEAP
jgi:hypothetical protein